MFHQELQEENEKLKHLGGCSHGHEILGLGDHLFWSCLVNHLIGKMMGKYQSDLIFPDIFLGHDECFDLLMIDQLAK